MEQVEKPVKLSARTQVTLRLMKPSETLLADEYVGSTLSPMKAYKTYAVCCLRSINGQPVVPLQDQVQFERTMDMLDLFELDKLVEEFRAMSTIPVDELKNESAAQSEGSLPLQ